MTRQRLPLRAADEAVVQVGHPAALRRPPVPAEHPVHPAVPAPDVVQRVHRQHRHQL
jgi:hypothetical protein